MRALSIARSAFRRPPMVLCAAMALVACLPIWFVRYVPVQDLPVHTAAIRVIHSLDDPTYGLSTNYVLALGKTQYLLFYLVGSAFSYLFGVRGAATALLTFYVVGTVLATALLARTLNKDERLSLYTIPFIYNCSFVIGFLPFLMGIPILLSALAIAIRFLAAPTRRRAILLTTLTIALFYSHIAPFVMFTIGYAALFLFSQRRRWVHLLPCVPVALLCAHWLFFTDAGRATRETLTEKGDPPWPLDQAIQRVYDLSFNIFRDQSDEAIFISLIVAGLVVLSLGQGERARSSPTARILGIIPIISILFFLRSGHRVGYVAHIRDRFPILFVFTFIPLLHFPHRWRGHVASALLVSVGAVSSYNTLQHFRQFQEEVGAFDRALSSMEPGRNVAALIYENSSRIMTQAPFLHFGSYYQVDRGGIVQFSFAGYPHWPFGYAPGKEIPPGNPYGEGWCWGPQNIPIEGLYPYFDYVLTRGSLFHPPNDKFQIVYGDAHWRVFRRSGATP